MSSLATALKNEIQRLAKREAVAVVKDVKAALKEERKQVKTLEGTIKAQAREIASLRQAMEKGSMAVAAPAKPAATAKKGTAKSAKGAKAVKSAVKGWRKDSVSSTRRLHDLSQNAFAKLVGVGLNTVWLWENGRTNPRPKQQEAVLALRDLTPRQVGNRLTGLGLAVGKQKPGRKKKAPAAAGTARKEVKATKTAKKPAKKAAKKAAPKPARKTTRRKKASSK
jgi:DNA-binding transcriptional regulator YiaG